MKKSRWERNDGGVWRKDGPAQEPQVRTIVLLITLAVLSKSEAEAFPDASTNVH